MLPYYIMYTNLKAKNDRGDERVLFCRKKIRSFVKAELSISSARSTTVFELINKGEKTEITSYSLPPGSDSERRLEKRAAADTEEITRLLNDCRVLNMNGFKGKNPRNIRDGYMFSLSVEVNDGIMIRASGSNKYPRHFREFKEKITELLGE